MVCIIIISPKLYNSIDWIHVYYSLYFYMQYGTSLQCIFVLHYMVVKCSILYAKAYLYSTLSRITFVLSYHTVLVAYVALYHIR